MKHIPKTCALCGVPFIATGSNALRQKYCSPRCAKRDFDRRKAAERRCRGCGAALVLVPGQRISPSGFCSASCRFESYVVRHDPATDPDGCDLWTARSDRNGYGCFETSRGTQFIAHRYAWSQAYGPIAPGLDGGHRCHDRAAALGECAGGPTCLHRRCVRLDHLLLQTRRENLLSSPLTLPARSAAREVCPQGHPLTDEKLENGVMHRYCRTCDLARRATVRVFVKEAASVLGLSCSEYVRRYGKSVPTASAIISNGSAHADE
jgi:hypothetical protein